MNTSSKTETPNDSHSGPVQHSGGFTSLDVGSPQLAGAATTVTAGWDIVAGGADIWEKSDQFHFVFQECAGDFDIAVRVESFTPAHLYSNSAITLNSKPSSNTQ